jgi:rhodanese-related sulfurtransferase
MTSWHSDFDSWSGNVSSYYAQFLETAANAIGAEGDYPVIDTGEDNGEDILMARIQDIFDEGFSANAIAATNVTDAPSNYYVVNYWPNGQYLDPGHIPGAYCYEPGSSFTTATNLATLPTDETIVVYCYTGQTSAFMAAFLNVLGYDAKTLKFGANSMFTGTLPASNWSVSNIKEYDYDSNVTK